jgi:hypothetical protein
MSDPNTVHQNQIKRNKHPRKYEIGHLVYVAIKGLPFTQARIVGHEWGENHRDFRCEQWLYYIRENGTDEGSQQVLVREDQISDRIS